MGRRSRTFTILTIAVALASVAAPVAIAIVQARRQALEYESKRALSFASDVVNRMELTTSQVTEELDVVARVAANGPCSDRTLAAMRQMDVGSRQIQAVGYIEQDALVCSSLGIHRSPIPLGPANVATAGGNRVWTDAELPFAPGMRFVIVQHGPFVAILHKGLSIDAIASEDSMVAANFVGAEDALLFSRGDFRRTWLRRSGGSAPVTFADGQYLVAVARSSQYRLGAVAAIPVGDVDRRVRASASVLIPFGALAGVIMAAAVRQVAKWHRSMKSLLRAALRRDEFLVVYEPIVDVNTGAWVGAEALVRWKRANGEVVRPDVFIPIAEDSGLINQITERVLSIVDRDLTQILLGRPRFHVSINLAAADLHSAGSPAMVHDVVRRHRLEPGQLAVEISERGVLQTDLAARVIRDLRTAGAAVAIDDFGTGYSCLSYLDSLELDMLKIDRSFVHALGTKAPTSQVALHIIAMAKALGLRVIAEGVETADQLEFLRSNGVELAQGYLFSYPLSLAELKGRLDGSRESLEGGSRGHAA